MSRTCGSRTEFWYDKGKLRTRSCKVRISSRRCSPSCHIFGTSLLPPAWVVLICGQQIHRDTTAELWMPSFKYVRRSQKVTIIRFAEGTVADLISLFLFQNAKLHPYRITFSRQRFSREPFGVVCKSLTPVAEHEPCDRVSYRDVHDISWFQQFDLLKDEWHVQPGDSS
jgi:hypothetical protein